MDNLTTHWQRMSLNAREGEELGLEDELSNRKFTMAAKFFTRRALNVEAITRTFNPLWRSVKGFEVRRSSDHVLLFTFEKKEEIERIMNNAPWSFDKHLVVLQRCDKETPIKELKFDKIPLWVQLHDIPVRFMNKAVAEKLCAVVGTIWPNIEEDEMDGGSFLRMKVTIDINKPLCRGRLISLPHGEQSWVSFKYERLPNICYWCGCLSHGDRDCELWIESEGNLSKESQAYGAWIRAAPFVKSRNSVIKVPGFYAAKKAQQKQKAMERGTNAPVELNGDQPWTMEHAQTEAGASFQEAFNERSVEADSKDTLDDSGRSNGQDSSEIFEERLKEIDTELERFDKAGSELTGDNLETEKAGMKELKQLRKDEMPTLRATDRLAEDPDSHAEKVVTMKGHSQARVHKTGAVEPNIDPGETFATYDASTNFEPAWFVKPDGKAQPNGPILQPDSMGSPLAEKKEESNSKKPKSQGTWTRIPRATKIPIKGTEDGVAENRRETIQRADPRLSKIQKTSDDEVLCSTPAAVAVVQPRRKP